MKVLVAGATGVIGLPLIERLKLAGHQVSGIVRSDGEAEQLAALGAKPVRADVFNAEQVRAAMQQVQPDAVIDQLSALPRNPNDVGDSFANDFEIRVKGGNNVFEAAEISGVGRYLEQSSGFYLAARGGLADETAGMRIDAPGTTGASARMFTQLERRVLGSSQMKGTALRYGFLYGPGTWYRPDGAAADQARAKAMPIMGEGTAIWSFVHVEDAVAATVAALRAEPGVYNVVDDDPQSVRVWLPAFARWVDAPEPDMISAEKAMETVGAEGLYYHTKLTGASNAKARSVLRFNPRPLAWKMFEPSRI